MSSDLAPLVGQIIHRIDKQFDGVIDNAAAWEFTALAAAAFLPDYVRIHWPAMKIALFEPVNENDDDSDPKSIQRLKCMTLADAKSVVIQHATYKR